MSKTVVGLFSTMAQAQQVKQTLVSNGYETQNIHVVANNDDNTSTMDAGSTSMGTGSATTNTGSSTTGNLASGAEGMGEKIGNFFRNLTGGDETAHNHYATGVNGGGALVAVTVADEKATQTAQLLRQHGASEIEGQGQGAATSTSASRGGSTAATGNIAGNVAGNATGETVIPIVEEELVVGKREVDHGGVRVYSHVTERPVEAEVTLREERINVERRPVNRPATAADFQTGSGSVVELNAMAEEAVVGKSSRVVEEVRVGKQSSEHSEAIHDTVRKTEVDVENIQANTGTGKTGTTGNYADDVTTASTTKNRY
jgi:uncharacterized protein (TIGR02271 family)